MTVPFISSGKPLEAVTAGPISLMTPREKVITVVAIAAIAAGVALSIVAPPLTALFVVGVVLASGGAIGVVARAVSIYCRIHRMESLLQEVTQALIRNPNENPIEVAAQALDMPPLVLHWIIKRSAPTTRAAAAEVERGSVEWVAAQLSTTVEALKVALADVSIYKNHRSETVKRINLPSERGDDRGTIEVNKESIDRVSGRLGMPKDVAFAIVKALAVYEEEEFKNQEEEQRLCEIAHRYGYRHRTVDFVGAEVTYEFNKRIFNAVMVEIAKGYAEKEFDREVVRQLLVEYSLRAVVENLTRLFGDATRIAAKAIGVAPERLEFAIERARRGEAGEAGEAGEVVVNAANRLGLTVAQLKTALNYIALNEIEWLKQAEQLEVWVDRKILSWQEAPPSDGHINVTEERLGVLAGLVELDTGLVELDKRVLYHVIAHEMTEKEKKDPFKTFYQRAANALKDPSSVSAAADGKVVMLEAPLLKIAVMATAKALYIQKLEKGVVSSSERRREAV